MQVSLDQSDCLFINFFSKLTLAEPVCRHIIVIVDVSNVCNIYKWANRRAGVEYFAKMGSYYATDMISVGQRIHHVILIHMNEKQGYLLVLNHSERGIQCIYGYTKMTLLVLC
jgi:hypothetical protein